MNEIEQLRAELEAQKAVIVALLAAQDVTSKQALRAALQRSQEIHDASLPYSPSLSDAQLDYVQRYLAALIERLPQ